MSSKPDELLSPRRVAEALGVSESSVKRWSDEGLLATQKTAGGHRKLARADVLRFVRERGYDVDKPELLGLAKLPKAPLLDPTTHAQLYAALVAGDAAAIRRLLVGLFVREEALTSIFDEVLAVALRQLGTGWEHGTVNVFEEHRAIELVHRALHEIRQLLLNRTRGKGRPTALVATLSGDPYTVATTLAELTLTDLSWTASNLGCDLPVASLVAAISSLTPRMVCVGINHVGDVDRFVEDYQLVAEAARAHRSALVIGGARASLELRARIRYATCCASMRELADFAVTLEPPP